MTENSPCDPEVFEVEDLPEAGETCSLGQVIGYYCGHLFRNWVAILDWVSWAEMLNDPDNDWAGRVGRVRYFTYQHEGPARVALILRRVTTIGDELHFGLTDSGTTKTPLCP